MKKWLLLLSILLILIPNDTLAQDTTNYDVIIVRSDIQVEYIIALPYSSMHNIPIIQVSQNTLSDQELQQLQGYYENGARRALILGGTENAVSEDIAEAIHSIGFSVDRKWGVARESTAAIFATDFWESSGEVVLLNGTDTKSFLMGARIAMELSCPILLTEADTLSESASETISRLGADIAYVVQDSLSEDITASLKALGVDYVIVGSDIDYTDIKKENGMNIGIFFFIAGLAIGGTGVFLGGKLRKKGVTEVPLFVLTEDERKVVSSIEGEGGEMHQDKLPDRTNFSRPKVSRIVNDLESKKIIFREKYGKTYKVKIAKKFINNE